MTKPTDNSPVTRGEFDKLMALVPEILGATGHNGDLTVSSRVGKGATELSSVLRNVNAVGSTQKVSGQQLRIDECVDLFNELYDLVYAKENDVVLIRNKYARYAHRPLGETEGVRLITKMYKRRYPRTNLPDNVAHTVYKTICNLSDKEVKTMDDKLILVGYNSDKEGIIINTLYWNANDGQFVKDIQNKRCFRRLFDNGASGDPDDEENEEWRYRLRLEDIDQDVVVKVFNTARAILERFNGNFVPMKDMKPSDIEFLEGYDGADMDIVKLLDFTDDESPINTFWVWSNGNKGRTNDLLKAASSVFLKKKPTGAFLLVGKTRNGKSTFIDMLKAELGIQNTSGVKLTDFDDTTHFADDLATTMLNAPDDDEDGKEEKILKSQGTFKTITAHGMISVRRLYSSNSIKLHARWMNIFPMNDIPGWQGSSKEACMKRSLCISFNNDLSRSDKASKDFASETFTAAFYSVLLGVQGAIANYYNSHELKFSEEMEAMRAEIKEDIDGEDVFVDKLTSLFKGMNIVTVESEYQIWSRLRHIRYDTKQMKKRLKMALGWETSRDHKRSTYYDYVTGRGCTYERFGESIKNNSDIVMSDKQQILVKVPVNGGVSYEDKLVSVEELHMSRTVGPDKKDEQSVIEEINNYILLTPEISTIEEYCAVLKKKCMDAIWT